MHILCSFVSSAYENDDFGLQRVAYASKARFEPLHRCSSGVADKAIITISSQFEAITKGTELKVFEQAYRK